MRVWFAVVAIAMVSLVGLAASARAEGGPESVCYDFEEVNVPAPDGGELFTSWMGLNDRGQVVGNYCIDPGCGPVGPDGDLVGGVIYDERRGTFETFTLPPPYNWVGSAGINNWGVVVGQALVFDPAAGFVDAAGFIRDRRGRVSLLPKPKESASLWAAEDINDLGQIVGWFDDLDEDGRKRGFIYQLRPFREGSFRVYDVAETGQTQLNGINNRGDIVGSYADGEGAGAFVSGFIDERAARRWGRSRLSFISVPGDASTTAQGLNDRRQVVGWTGEAVGAPLREGLYYEDGAVVVLEFPGAISTRLTDINARGTIVGTFDVFSFGLIGRPTRCAVD